MIVITGASKGLGNAICKRLLQQKHEVFGLARNVSALDFPAVSCDISDSNSVKEAARSIKKTGKVVKGLINAAGVAAMNLAVTTPATVVQDVITTNLLGTIYCCQQFAPLMMRQKNGFIINFSTIAVELGLTGESVYVASKAGVEGFSRVFSREMSNFNITVNCIAPGPIATNLLRGITEEQISNIVSRQVIQKQYEPEAICDLVEMLMDPKSASLSGQIFHVGGV